MISVCAGRRLLLCLSVAAMAIVTTWIMFGCWIFLVSADPINPKRPHIIFFLADDVGWNDVSFHGSDQIPTPNIDALAYHGIILNNHYVQQVCTPSRAALMTGKYPIHTGMQGNPLLGCETRALPLSERILPQELKTLGYKTSLVGKWHLGFYNEAYMPLYRGFDTHFGYLTGAVSYYDRIYQDVTPEAFYGYDWRRNHNTSWEGVGEYVTHLLTKEAVEVIRSHGQRDSTSKDDADPLFLMVAHFACHAGNPGKWLEAPQCEIDKFSYIHDPNRRTYAAMMSLLDRSVGMIVRALEEKDMLRNSMIVFVSDNGAPVNGQYYQNWGSNYPYRGDKATLWQGALKTPALVWSPHLQSKSRVSNQLLHISDWLPTLIAAAGGDTGKLAAELDGVNQWEALSQNLESRRSKVLCNINERSGYGAIVIGKYKYIQGVDPFNGTHHGFLNPQDQSGIPAYNARKHDLYKLLSRYSNSPPSPSQLRIEATLRCSQEPVNVTCPCLFDLSEDPCERVNLYNKHPKLAASIKSEYLKLEASLIPQPYSFCDVQSNPKHFNYTWSSWVL